MDLKDNPLDEELQSEAGKCLNKKECRLCAERVRRYMENRKEEYEKEQAIILKKKQANEKAKVKKREKQAEKEREEKRQKRLEIAQKRTAEKEQAKAETGETEAETEQEEDVDEEPQEGFGKHLDNQNAKLSRDFLVSQMIDGVLNGLLISLMSLFAWQLYRNGHQPLNLRDFYKHI